MLSLKSKKNRQVGETGKKKTMLEIVATTVVTMRSTDWQLPAVLLLMPDYSSLYFRSLKLDLLSSIFQGLYPTEGDCEMVKHFISCPASLEVRILN